MKALGRLAVASCLAVSNAGCWVLLPSLDKDDRDPPPDVSLAQGDPDAGVDAAQSIPPPNISDIDVPDWPPLGATGQVKVTVTSTAPLATIEYGFKNHIVRAPYETSVTGLELGEGFGTLSVRATDTRGGYATREVTDLLVDLTPPEITLTDTVIPSDGKLALWVADAWILGRVELDFSGVQRSQQFQVGYPDTLGKTWDVSLVEFYADELPEGAGPAQITAFDAAGNQVTKDFDLVVDGTPPQVAFLEPAADAVVTDELRVTLQAHDESELPVHIELAVGGSRVATVTGPVATLVLNANDFPVGSLDLEATAIDEAGNRSEVAVVPITVSEAATTGGAP